MKKLVPLGALLHIVNIVVIMFTTQIIHLGYWEAGIEIPRWPLIYICMLAYACLFIVYNRLARALPIPLAAFIISSSGLWVPYLEYSKLPSAKMVLNIIPVAITGAALFGYLYKTKSLFEYKSDTAENK